MKIKPTFNEQGLHVVAATNLFADTLKDLETDKDSKWVILLVFNNKDQHTTKPDANLAYVWGHSPEDVIEKAFDKFTEEAVMQGTLCRVVGYVKNLIEKETD